MEPTLPPDKKILQKDFYRKEKTGKQIKPIEYRRINLPCFDVVGYKTKILILRIKQATNLKNYKEENCGLW